MTGIIGRTKEIKALHHYMSTSSSEFIAVYGRRRVGKTFLIREALDNKFSFHITGLANATMKQQLANFHTALLKHNPRKSKRPMPINWFEAFQQLIAFLEKSKSKKKIVFIDELPWMDTLKSDCINALEHFWNHWASARKDVKLIVCGSAASWMLKKIIRNKGGLHNRVTQKIKLLPFTLSETEQYLVSKNLKWNRYQVTEAYMVMGGIPYYLNGIVKGKSAAQCIDEMCFIEAGLLYDEFSNLYASLFRHADNHIAVVEALSRKAMGLSREQIVAVSKLANGGGLSKVLDELEESGFIRKYLPFKNKLKHSVYQLTDFYTLFYFNFIRNKKTLIQNYWEKSIDSPRHRAWSGYAFEQVCQAHVHQIKKALGISGVQAGVVSWRSSNSENNTQVDLIIDRNDQVINLCEIKFSINQFTIDKKYAAVLRNRIDVFKRESKTRKAVFSYYAYNLWH